MNEQTISPALDGLRWLEAAIFAGNIPVAIQTFIWLVDCGWDYGDLVEELHHIHYAVHQARLEEQHILSRLHDLLDCGWDYGDLVEELHHIHYAVHQARLEEQHILSRLHDLLDADDRQEV